MDALLSPSLFVPRKASRTQSLLPSNHISIAPFRAPFVTKTRKVYVWQSCRRSNAMTVCCSRWKGPRSSGSNSSNSSRRRWDNQDDEFVEAHVLEAVSILPSHGHLFMGLANGHEIEVEYVNPAKGPLLFRSRHPSIFLKIHDGSDVLLPIVVGEMAVNTLMKALHGNEKIVRPNSYHLMKDLLDALNYEVQMIRITERVIDTYHSRIYLGRADVEGIQSVDARPSDAINLAVRCKVPIYVNRRIIAADAVKPVCISHDNCLMDNEASFLDCPGNGPDPVAEELTLMKNMLLAVVEERYSDAAHWRDKLYTLRTRKHQLRKM